MPTPYHLECLHCHKIFTDSSRDLWLKCDESHTPSLLRTVYGQRRFTVDKTEEGLFRYREWLPVRQQWATSASPVVYRSEHLASRLGLENLWIAFSGYWPDRGASLRTCSFKELEAIAVCARLGAAWEKTLVVASAGNTARAFLQVASERGIPVEVVIPQRALAEMWMTVERSPRVKLTVVGGDSDYTDAMNVAVRVAAKQGQFHEGGVMNIARRDALGTILLMAVEKMGRIPDHYVQAVGSGTGGIGVWEMNQRLLLDGRFGHKKMKLHLVQNAPFSVMARAWETCSRSLPVVDAALARTHESMMHSAVLANRRPPYEIIGGVFDALTDTGGDMYAVSNDDAIGAAQLFRQAENCDLDPAAEVALAGLIRARKMGRIGRDDCVLLNLSGGGRGKLASEITPQAVNPDALLPRQELP